MIAAAMVCAAAIVQAASCNWATEYTMVTGESEERTGNIAYTWAIVESATADFSAFSFDGGTLVGGTALATGSSNVELYGKSSGSFAGATAGNYYALVIHTEENGGYWGISDGILANADPTDATGNTLMNMTFANGTDVFGYGENAMVANRADAAIPEPTSGLLMLLGVAGLALRRRRA